MSRKRMLILLFTVACLLVLILLFSSRDRFTVFRQGAGTGPRTQAGSPGSDVKRPGIGAAEPSAEEKEEPGAMHRPGILDKREPGTGHASEFRLRGKVRTEDKQPLAGAEVLACESPNPRDCSTSAWRSISVADGSYELSVPFRRGRSYRLKVSSDGFTTLEGQLRMEAPGELERNFVLEPAVAWIKGRMVDPDGAPVQGGRVMVMLRTRRPDMAGNQGVGMAYIGGKREEMLTDANGEFGAEGFPPGLVSVFPNAPGYRAAIIELELKPGENRVEVRLLPARIVTIRVVNSRRQAVGDAIAFCRGFAERFIEPERSRPGLLTLKVDPEIDECQCEIRAEGYLWKAVSFQAASPPTEVVLEDGSILTGRVVSDSGQPIAEARIFVTVHREEGRSSGSFGVGGAPKTTNSDGYFTIALPSDRFLDVGASARGYLDSRIWIESLETGAERTIVLKKPEGALTGRVVDPSGNPVTDFQVNLISVVKAPFPQSRGPAARPGWGARPDFSTFGRFQQAEGLFSFPELPSGELQIHVSTVPGPEGLRKSQTVQIPKGATADVLIQLEPARQRR